jgi:FHS family L-fucose permease-like MFS transporter
MPVGPARDALLNEFASRVFLPYMTLAGVLVVLAIWIVRSSLPEIKPMAPTANARSACKGGIFSFPHLWLGVLCLFLYVGVEVMAGDAINTYGQGFGLPLQVTPHFTAYTMVSMLAGYVSGLLLIPRFISQQRYLAVSAVLGVLFAHRCLRHPRLCVGCFCRRAGFANAMMWPAIFPLAIKGLGSHTELGSALLIMGIVGGALLPQAFVHLKQHIDFQLAFLVVIVPCYLYILYYGVRGHSVGNHAV